MRLAILSIDHIDWLINQSINQLTSNLISNFSIVKLQPDLEPNLNELKQTWTSRVRSWLCFPMSQEQEQEQQDCAELGLSTGWDS